MSSASPSPPSTLGQQLLHWLPLITAVVLTASTIFGVRSQVDRNTERIAELKTELSAAASKQEVQQLDLRVQKLESVIYQMSADLQYIRGRMEGK